MRRINLSLFLLFATFGCYLCQGNQTTTVAPTTTKAPDSTTPSPNTTTTTTTTTPTPPPQTTTVAPVPPTTPAPVPTGLIKGNVTEPDRICLRFEFAVHFNIKYTDIQNQTQLASVPLSSNSALGFPDKACSDSKETFWLTHGKLNFTLTFARNDKSVFLDSITLLGTYDNISFPNITKDKADKPFNLTLSSRTLSPNFNVEKSHSYSCANVTVPKDGKDDLQVVFSSLKLQAFMDKDQKGEFSSEHNCQNEINDVVPIAVGAALTGLVVIVMIAYFIGRRRSRRLAYQSV